MTREIRTSSVGLKVNNALKDFPILSIREVQEILGLLCLKATVTKSSKKTHKSFRNAMELAESWADGFVAGGGGELVLLSGIINIENLGLGGPIQRPVILFVHHKTSVDQFIDQLREFAKVASVQKS